MKVLVAGGTGFIGQALCEFLLRHGHELLVLTRDPSSQPTHEGLRYFAWNDPQWREQMSSIDGVVNLAGESLAAKRWTPTQKRTIETSRLQPTTALIEAMSQHSNRPRVMVSASAIGYYGPQGDEEVTETSGAGKGFLSTLCVAWEAAAQQAESLGVRVVRLRFGVVLGPDGGALKKMVTPFRFFIGGPLGSGHRWISWIHRDDVHGLIRWALTTSQLSGPVNATAPGPVTMQTFSYELGRALHRPSWARVPSFVLRALLGEMADMLLTGQRVIPSVALRQGYRFSYPELPGALEACLR